MASADSGPKAPEVGTEFRHPESGTPAEVLDLAALLERCCGKQALAHRLLSRFAETVQHELEALRHAVDERNPGAASEVAHRLKGTAANLGLDALRSAAAELEAAGRRGEVDACAALVAGVEGAAAVAVERIELLLAADPGVVGVG